MHKALRVGPASRSQQREECAQEANENEDAQSHYLSPTLFFTSS